MAVWSGFVRVFHWALAASFITAWWAGDDYADLHEWAGYTAAALIAVRIVVGFAGSGYARFAQFVKSPRIVLSYLADIAKGRERRYIGHNPAGGAMVVTLLLTVAVICLTGWLLTDIVWGSLFWERVHEYLTNFAFILIALHLAGVAIASLRHRENLVKAMVTGKKREPADGDVA